MLEPPVTIKKASELTGLSQAAIRQKIFYGQWTEGRHYHRGPDGRIYVDMEGYRRWVAGDRVLA